MRLMKFQVRAEHVKGKDLTDADSLSRAPHEQPTKEDEIAETEITMHVNTIFDNIPASADRLEEIREHTRKDGELQVIIKNVQEGWPKTKADNPVTQMYWQDHHSMTFINGLLLKGEKIVIPASLRQNMLQKIHEGHLGMDKCKRRARSCIYWPHMNNHIEQIVRKCEECMKLLPAKPAEPLKTHEVPTKPWVKIASDLFDYGGNQYAVIVDYFTLWPEVYKLEKADAQTLIETMKNCFSRHGIPQEIVSDNGRQYAARRFRQFTREWQIKHTFSSPRYPRSNGLAESMVKSVKRLFRKCHRSNQDVQKGLLILRNTPLQCGRSPEELMFGRQLQDNLPRWQPQTESNIKRPVEQERQQIKRYHDSKINTRRSNTYFTDGQRVAIQDERTNEWSRKGHIVQMVEPRSYTIRMDDTGNTLRRNQRHIRKVYTITAQQQQPAERGQEDNQHWDAESGERTLTASENDSETETIPYCGDSDNVNTYQTRSGRTVQKKSPTDYNDL